MNKAIQYREDGKFYGLVNVPNPEHFKDDGVSSWNRERYLRYMESCIAAGKEIINPEVLKGQLEWVKGVHGNGVSPLKVGDIFDCPDNIEFEEDQFCAYHNLNCSYCGTCAGSCYKPEKIIRLKLKDEDMHWGIHLKSKDIDHDIARIVNGNFMELASTGVKPVETQDELWNEAVGIVHGCEITQEDPVDDLKSKFTIQRNKNGNE